MDDYPPVVTEHFKVTIQWPNVDEVDYWTACYQTNWSVDGWRCHSLSEVKKVESNKVEALLTAMRVGEDTGVLRVRGAKTPDVSLSFNMTQEQLEAASTVEYTAWSNQIPLPQAKKAPEPGLVSMLIIGILGLTMIGRKRKWLRRNNSNPSNVVLG